MQHTKESDREIIRQSGRMEMQIRQTITSIRHHDLVIQKPIQCEKYFMENGLYSKSVFHRQRQLTNVLIALLIVDTVLLYLFYQAESVRVFGQVWLPLSCAINFGSTFIFIILIVLRFEEKKYRSEGILKSVFEVCLFLMVHPMVWWKNHTVSLSYDDQNFENKRVQLQINHLLIILAIIKNLALCYFKILVNTHYLNPRGKRLKTMYSVEMSQEMYAIKCMFKESPIRMFIPVYLVGYFYFSFTFKIIESTVPVQDNPFRYYQNCVWFTFITATSVGYGDMKNFTHLGYILNVFCMIWGALATSCILVILINTLSLNSKEEESLSSLNHTENELKLRQLSRHFIRKSLWRVWTNYKLKINQRQSTQQRRMRVELLQLRRQQKLTNSSNNIVQISQSLFDNVIKTSHLLKCNNNQLINFIGNHIFSQSLFYQRKAKQRLFFDQIQQRESDDYESQQKSQKQLSSSKPIQNKSRLVSRKLTTRPKKEKTVTIQDIEDDELTISQNTIGKDCSEPNK